MKIKLTNIPDISKHVDQAKADLGSKVVENISPLLDECYQSKTDEILALKKSIKESKQLIKSKKEFLESLIDELNKKKKIKSLLEKISKLINAGLVYDSHFRNEMIVLLKVLDNLPEQKIDFHLKDVTSILSKRFK